MPRKEGTQMLLRLRLLHVFGFVAFISTVAADNIHSCDFDTDDCGYLSPVSNDFDWSRKVGSTPTSGTGPSSDHTTGSGYYMYIETSTKNQGDIAALLTPSMNSTSGQVCVSFWYLAYGSTLGELHMSVVTSSVYMTRDFSFDDGTSENRWKYVEASAMLAETSFQVKFDGIRGSSNYGDIGIDDVTVNDTLCAGHVGSASNLVVTAHTNTSASLSWDPPTIGLDNLQNFVIEAYDCIDAETPQLTMSGITQTYTTVSGLNPDSNYVFAVYANGTNNLARPANVTQRIISNQTVLFSCDFDNCGICDMEQDDTDDFDWKRNQGSTPSSYTGPSSDHTTGIASGQGAGYYLFFESTSPVLADDRARVTTPSVNTTNTQACLSFWLHAKGRYLGVFNVRIVTSSGIEVRTIAQNPSSVDSWVQTMVPIEEDSFQIQFEAIDTANDESDFAIDDIVIIDGWCEGHSSGIRNPAVTSANDSSVTIQWTAPLLGSSDVQQYTILAYQCMNKTSADHVVSSNFTSVTLTGLAAYSMWTFSILPVTAVASFPETVNITGWTRPLDTAHVCNFDCDTCGYVQATDDEMDWVLNSGSTPTSSTGPTGDHTTGSGNYFYFEVNTGSTGDIARIKTPLINVTSGWACISFWYHAYGSHLGEMRIRKVNATKNTTIKIADINSNNNAWIQFEEVASMGSAPFWIEFEAERAQYTRGDFAFDDVSVLDGYCEGHCGEIADPVFVTSSSNTATLSWTAATVGSENVQYYTIDAFKTCAFDRSRGIPVSPATSSNATSSPAVISGLESGTHYTFVVTPVCTNAQTSVNVTGWTQNEIGSCNQIIEDTTTTGFITSTNFPSNYNSSQECTWLFFVPADGTQNVELRYESFAVEDGYDFVKIYTDICDSSPNHTDTGAVAANKLLRAVSVFVVTFESDHDTEERGFNLTFDTNYNALYRELTGTIEPEGYPVAYNPNMDETYTIRPSQTFPNTEILLNFTDFDLQDSSNCSSDYLQVVVNFAVVTTFCGNSLPNETALLATEVTLVFHSDGITQGRGFSVTFTVREAIQTTTEALTTTAEETTTEDVTTVEAVTTVEVVTTTEAMTTTMATTTTTQSPEESLNLLAGLDPLNMAPDAFAGAILSVAAGFASDPNSNATKNESVVNELARQMTATLLLFSTGNASLSPSVASAVTGGLAVIPVADENAASDMLIAGTNFVAKLTGTVGEMTSSAENLLTATGNVLGSKESSSSSSSTSSRKRRSTDLAREKADADKTEGLVDGLGGKMANGMNASSAPVTISNSQVSLGVQKSDSSSLSGQNISNSMSSVEMPSVNSSGNVAVKIGSFKKSPKSYSDNANDVNSASVNLDVRDDNGVSAAPSTPVTIAMSSGRTEPLQQNNVTNPNGSTTYINYKVSSPTASVFFDITKGNPSTNYTVLGQYGSKPNATNYIFRTVSGPDEGAVINIIIPSYTNATSSTSKRRRRSTSTTVDLFIAVTEAQENGTVNASSSFSYQAMAVDPRMWNAATNSWESDPGLEISSDSTPEKVVFKSNFFGSFAAGLFEPPNTIDFEAVFANFGERLLDNAYVFGFLIALIVIYILTIFYCRWKDKKDKELWAYAPLTDNRPKDSYYYRISVQTAVRSISRCSANIFFILHGENGKTRPRHLADGERKCFGNGSTNNFTMAVPKYLGRLKYMQVWIDDTGPSPHWLPNKVIMYDIQERKRFYFMGSRWLSATKSDKRTNRLLKSQTEDEFRDFNALFSENASKNFFDDHLWVSIFSRPTTSRFTRVQRLSVSVALLFLGMITNAMFYRGDDEGSSSSGLQIGPITITFRQIWVGLVGALIVLPPAVIMIEIFRRSRERKRSKTPAWTIVAEANINSSGPRIGLEGSKCDLSGDLKKHSCENVNEVDGLSGKGSDEGIGSLGGLGSQKDLQPVATVSDIHIPYTYPALPPQYQDIYYDKTEGSDDTDLLMAFALQPSSNEDFMNTLDHLDESKKKKKPKGPLTLPWGFVIIGYIIVFLSIAASAFFTLLYSLQWGKEKSLGWLLSMFFTIVQSLILVQPVKVVLMAVVFSCFMKLPAVEDEDDVNMDDVTVLRSTPLPVPVTIIVPRNLESPDDAPDDVEIRQKKIKLEEKMMSNFKSIFVHLVHLCLLLIIAFSNRDDNFFLQNEALVKGLSLEDTSFGKLDDLWPWLTDTIVPEVFPTTEYNSDALSTYDLQFISILCGLRLGPLRVRQVRANKRTCNVVPPMDNLTTACSAPWYSEQSPTSNFTEAWAEVNTTIGDVVPVGFDYKVQNTPNDYYQTGMFGSYQPSGYMVDVNSDSEAITVFNQLKQNNWLDKYTRAVFVEFTINNAFVNVFTMVRLIVEFPVTGGIFFTHKETSFRPYPYVEAFDFILLVIQVIWAIFVIYFFIAAMIRAVKTKGKCFKDMWFLLEFFDCLFAFASMAFFILRTFRLIQVVEEVKNNIGKFVPFDRVTFWDEAYTACIATDTFLVLMQLFKPMAFVEQLAVLKYALVKSFTRVLLYMVIFILLLYSFAVSLNFMSGDYMWVFRDVPHAIYNLFGVMIGLVKYDDVKEDDSFIIVLVFLAFTSSMNFILLNLFISIINDTVTEAKEDDNSDMFDRELNEHLNEKLRDMFGKKEEQEKKAVTFESTLSIKSKVHPAPPAIVISDYEQNDAPKSEAPPEATVQQDGTNSGAFNSLQPEKPVKAGNKKAVDVKSTLGKSFLVAKYHGNNGKRGKYDKSVTAALDLAYLMEKSFNCCVQTLEAELQDTRNEIEIRKRENTKLRDQLAKAQNVIAQTRQTIAGIKTNMRKMIQGELRRLSVEGVQSDQIKGELITRVEKKYEALTKYRNRPEAWTLISLRNRQNEFLAFAKAIPGLFDENDVTVEEEDPAIIIGRAGCSDVKGVIGQVIALKRAEDFDYEEKLFLGIPILGKTKLTSSGVSLRASYDESGEFWETTPHKISKVKIDDKPFQCIYGVFNGIPNRFAAVHLYDRQSFKISPAGGVVTPTDEKDFIMTFEQKTFSETSDVSLQAVPLSEHLTYPSDKKGLYILFERKTFLETANVSIQVLPLSDRQKANTSMLSDTVNFSVSCKGFKVVNIQLPIFTDAIKDEEEVQVFTKYGRLGWQYSGMAYRVNKERKVLNFVLRLPDVGEYAWFRVQRVKNDTEGKGLSPNDGDPINDSLLVKLAPMLGKDWESLAKHIGLSPQIFTNNSDDDTTNACAVLRKWSQSVPISADKASTLQKVFGQIGRQDLAALLKQS